MKNMILVCSLCFFWLFEISSQSRYEIIVYDECRNEIPYVNAYIRSNIQGAYSNNEGLIELSSDFLNANNQDTLCISCIGYHTEEIAIEKLLLSNRMDVVLRSMITVLPELIIPYGDKKFTYGFANFRTSSISFTGKEGQSLITFIENVDQKLGLVESVNFQIDKSSILPTQKYNLRIRFFSLVEDELVPNNSLKDSVLIISKFPRNNISIDLEKFAIPFTESGLYIGLEWIPQDNTVYNRKKTCSPLIKCTSSSDKRNTYILDVEDNEFYSYPKLTQEEIESIPKMFRKKIVNSNPKIGVVVRCACLM